MTDYVYPTARHDVSDSFQDHVNRGSVNPGVDYMARVGDRVVAVASGKVADADRSPDGGGGRTIHINHDDGTGSDYLHLSRVEVARGQHVERGALIGYSGASGYDRENYYGPHLHISFRPNHSGGYGNNGNQDFDAIMKAQRTPAEVAPVWDGDRDMRIIEGGTVALVGEYTGRVYNSPQGGEGFSWGANAQAYGTSSGLTNDQVMTLVNEARHRYELLVRDVSAAVIGELEALVTRAIAAPRAAYAEPSTEYAEPDDEPSD